MQPGTDWWSRCAFVRDYFFGGERKVAHQVAEYLARRYVGDGITALTPDTDVAALVGDSIRRKIHLDDFTLAHDDNVLADVDLKDSISFEALVRQIHEGWLARGEPAA
ncbi:MAG: hypothetical protein J0M16_00025 [Gammaproteobacteria bacterium]|jgi:hypothetical protein|nr:hypothetical protein [Gammaproteobacteria bacterium]